MKSIKLLLLCLAISCLSYAQNFNHIYKSIYSEHNGYEWVEITSAYPNDMYLILNGSDISINNDDKSKFKTYGSSRTSNYETHICYSWNCVDKDGRQCVFIMKRFISSNTWVMSFVYSDTKQMFEYIMYND